MPPILATPGRMIPRQFGPMMRAPRSPASSTICATSWRGMRSVTITTSRTPRGLVHRHAAVAVLDAVLLEDLEALLLPRARDAEDRHLLGRVVAQVEARPDHAAGHDVHAGVGDDAHHHRDLVHARLLQHQ